MKSFFQKDTVWLGISLGIVVPIVIYGVLLLIYETMDAIGVFSEVGMAEDFRTRTLALISICALLVMSQLYRGGYRRQETIRGVLIATMLLAAVWFWKFGLKIIGF